MKRSRCSKDQITGLLQEHKAGVSVADLWPQVDVSEAKRLKGLEDESARL